MSTLDTAGKKRWKNFEFLQSLPQDKKIMHIYSNYRKTTTCNHSKIFFVGTITRILCKRLKRWRKSLNFIIVSELICWIWAVCYQILQIFVFIARRMSSFTHSQKETKTCLKKIREVMVGGPSIVFTRKTVVGQTRTRSPSNTCKSIVGIDASHPYPYGMCRPMPTGLYTRWEFNADLQRFKHRSNKTRSFEHMVMTFIQNSRPDCNNESFYTTGTQRKVDCFSVDWFCSHCNTIFEALGCFYHFCESQEGQPCLTDEDIVKGQRKREIDNLRRPYLREKK